MVVKTDRVANFWAASCIANATMEKTCSNWSDDTLRRTWTKFNSISILGEEIEEVEGTNTWVFNLIKAEAVYRQDRTDSTSTPNVCSKTFYQSVVARTIFFAGICWGSSIKASDTKKLNILIKKAGSVLRTSLDYLELVVERRMLHKL